MHFCYGISMNLTHLRYFIVISEVGTITQAAQVLNVTQPAVTRGLKLLESELGVALFERHPRKMHLTRYGKGFLRHARIVFSQLENASSEIRHMLEIPVQEILIGAGPSWLTGELPSVVGELLRIYPEVSVRVRSGYDEQLRDMLTKGELAFVLTELSNDGVPDELEQEPLIECDYIVVCRKGHPLSSLKNVKLEQLLDYTWAMPDQAHRALDRLHGIFQSENLAFPQALVRSTSLSFILKFLETTDALSFVVRSSLEQHERLRLLAVNIDHQLPSRSAGIIRRKNSWESPPVEECIRLLREKCANRPIQ